MGSEPSVPVGNLSGKFPLFFSIFPKDAKIVIKQDDKAKAFFWGNKFKWPAPPALPKSVAEHAHDLANLSKHYELFLHDAFELTNSAKVVEFTPSIKGVKTRKRKVEYLF